MSAFDDLTLAEVEMISRDALGGKPMSDDSADPLAVAGGVMWITQRNSGEPELTWEQFKHRTKMGDIKAFSIDMEHQQMDPTNARS